MATQTEGATNSGDIKGKIDQHVGKNESTSGYKYQYVNTEKNKKLGIITADNVNHILYNLLWDICSHQVDNETAKGEMQEVNWLLRRYPKDSDRSDDTGVSNDTINKYVKKARDIVGNMKSLEEESIFVESGKITKHPSGEGKKLSEEVDEEESTEEQVDEGVKENLQYRVESAKSLIKNAREPKNVRRCLELDNKRLRKQLLTGKRTSIADVQEEATNEDTTVGKYTIKKVKEGTVDKWAVYDEAGNLRATYPDEQTAKDAVNGKKIYEEYDPFQDMEKDDNGKYTDGEGGSYSAPSSGTSKWIKKRNYQYRYNFGNKEIEIGDNSGEVIYHMGLSIGNWLDGPEYWFDRAYQEMEDEDEKFIQNYFKEHPEEDKRNISVADLKDPTYEEEEHAAEDNGEEVTEEVGKKFSSAADLEEFLKGKNDIVIYFDKGQYTILDDVGEEETSEEDEQPNESEKTE